MSFIHKQIFMGTGLDGGSTDGTFVITALNALFQLELSDDTLKG
ncbi:hypothetical protein KH5_13410 [Urechidicola sp. KH5]